MPEAGDKDSVNPVRRKSKFSERLDSAGSFIVYCVVNNLNGKSYIGITTRGLQVRWWAHLSEARYDRSKSVLHRAIKKYGEDAFSVSEIASASSWDELCALEQQLISEKGTLIPNGYNTARGGEGAFGVVMEGEALENVRAAAKKRSENPVWRHNVIEARRAQASNPVWVAAVAAAGGNKTPEWRMAVTAGAKRRAERQKAEKDAADPGGIEERAANKAKQDRHRDRKAGIPVPYLKRGPGNSPKFRAALDARIVANDLADPDGAAGRALERQQRADRKAGKNADKASNVQLDFLLDAAD